MKGKSALYPFNPIVILICMDVSEIMSRDVISVSPDDSIVTFMSAMEKEHIHEAPVINEKKKLLGMVRFDSLVKKSVADPVKQKIKSIIDFMPPALKPDQTIEEAADVLFKSGLRATPVVENGKVVGIVSIWDILEAVSGSKTFRQTKVENVMSVAEVISKDADIGTARVIMRERHISRLPVVDDNGKLVGIVTVHDLLKAFKQPKEKMAWYSMAAEMERVVSLPVSNLMNDRPQTISKNDSLTDAINLMIKYGTSGAVVTENNAPVGVVTIKDLFEVYVSGFAKKGIYYQVTGLEGEDDVVDTVHRMVGDTFKKIESVIPIQYAFLHFKKYSGGGLRNKWSVRIRLMTDKGLFVSREWDWDARDAARKSLSHLERVVERWKSERTTERKKAQRRIKEEMKE